MAREPQRPLRGKPLYEWAVSMWEVVMKNRLRAGPGITLRESSTGTTIAVRKRFFGKKVLPFEVTLIAKPPAQEGGDPTYVVTVAPGRVNERIPSDTDATKFTEPANLRDPADPEKLNEFPIEAGQAVFVKVEVDEDGAVNITGGGDPVLIEVAEEATTSTHYQPKVDDETMEGVAGTYYYKLAKVIPGDKPGELKLENILGGSHLSHWRELPSLRNTSNEPADTGLIMKKWDQPGQHYKLRVLTPGHGKTTIKTDPDEVVVRGNKRDGLVKVWEGDIEQTAAFMEWSDGLVETGTEINGDENPLPDPQELVLYLPVVVERPANAQVKVTEIGAPGKVYQVEGNGKDGNLSINGEIIASWIDGLWQNQGGINVEVDQLPTGNEGDMLYHDGTEWVVLQNPGLPSPGEFWKLEHNGNNPYWELQL